MDDTSPESNGQTTTADDPVRRERDEYYDRLLRTTAEFENYRKRTERERRELAEAAGVDVIRELLPVIDNLERALATDVAEEASGTALANFQSGVDMIRRQLLEILRQRGVEPLEAVGQDFDPEWHESVAHEPAGDQREGVVTSEVRRGYRIGTRLLRPAMVKVAKA